MHLRYDRELVPGESRRRARRGKNESLIHQLELGIATLADFHRSRARSVGARDPERNLGHECEVDRLWGETIGVSSSPMGVWKSSSADGRLV